MLFRGLKSRIIFNMALLLLIAMALIDLVVVATAQKQLLKSQADNARLAALLGAHTLSRISAAKEDLTVESIRSALRDTLKNSGSDCIVFADRLQAHVWPQGTGCSSNSAFRKMALDTAAHGSNGTLFDGTRWAVLWRGPRSVGASAPVINSRTVAGGVVAVFDLERVYAPMRKSQKILFIYVLINLVFLTLIGFYRISRLYLIPVNRMAVRANGYREDSDMPFAVRREDNELKALSNALNQMIRRIGQDKSKLQETVRSLESANRELRQAQDEVIRAEKLSTVGRLSSGIAHEIGNPIGIVLGYLALLKRPDVSATEKSDYIARSEDEISRVNSIIRQLLDFAKPTAGVPEAVSANLIIAEVADMLRVLPAMARIDFSVHSTAQADTVLADPNHLKQILINAVLNAADAIAAREPVTDGRISITSQVSCLEGRAENGAQKPCRQEMLTVKCRDNGVGIGEDQLAYIFDPFYTTKGPVKGTGLGLSVSYMIAEGMGGRLEVSSVLGRGSTLNLHLPLYRSEPVK